MTVSLIIKNKKNVTFNEIPEKVADVLYNYAKKGQLNRADLSIKCTSTYSKTLNGEYVDLKTFYKQNNIQPFSDKKFKHFEQTNVAVTFYDVKPNAFYADEPHNYPVVEMNMSFYTKKKDSLDGCIGAWLFDYDSFSSNIDFMYDEKWYRKVLQIKNKSINHLLVLAYSKANSLQTELDASQKKITEALKEVA